MKKILMAVVMLVLIVGCASTKSQEERTKDHCKVIRTLYNVESINKLNDKEYLVKDKSGEHYFVKIKYSSALFDNSFWVDSAARITNF